jgi:hypothetical protein
MRPISAVMEGDDTANRAGTQRNTPSGLSNSYLSDRLLADVD